jgi:hypothetical protein
VDEGPETYTVEEAAKVLKRTPGRIRQMLRAGEISGEHEAGDERKPWMVHKWSAHALRDRLQEDRPTTGRGPPSGSASRSPRGESRESPESASELFRVEDKAALGQALGADEATLRGMLRYASEANDPDYGRTVLYAAHSKGYGDIVAEFFNTVDPGARGLYEEYLGAPDEEAMRRQIENADRLVPEPTEAAVTGHPVYAGGGRSYGDL